jgi:hypothetical protein
MPNLLGYLVRYTPDHEVAAKLFFSRISFAATSWLRQKKYSTAKPSRSKCSSYFFTIPNAKNKVSNWREKAKIRSVEIGSLKKTDSRKLSIAKRIKSKYKIRSKLKLRKKRKVNSLSLFFLLCNKQYFVEFLVF